jgi:hypothetical protein
MNVNDDRFEQVLRFIDEANAADPNRETWEGREYPKEFLYGMRMTAGLERFCPEASEVLRIAARGQHIRRWEVPRDSYPATREGYLRWRSHLYGFHADQVAELMKRAGYEPAAIEQVKKILQKRGLKTDPDVQIIEDVACLVFLEHYFPAFMETRNEGKLVDIVRKTWNKMSEQARRQAQELAFSDPIRRLLAAALAAG